MPTRIFRGWRALRGLPRRTVVTIGVFDGVHLAHQRLIRATVRLAKRLQAASVIITFDPDPHHVLDPQHAPPSLMSPSARLQALAALGVDVIWVIPFSRSFARLSAKAFTERFVFRRLRAAAVILGEGFVFGRNRQGTMDTLRQLARQCSVRVIAVAHVRRQGAVVSSSRIRRLIARGSISAARSLLGRPPSLEGVVIRGAGRGAWLGFPTANIRLIPQAVPPHGVYAVMLEDLRRHRRWKGVTPPPVAIRRRRIASLKRWPLCGHAAGGGVMNFGVRPTFGGGPAVCEVHLFRDPGRLLGRRVIVWLIAPLRREQRFPSVEALQRQMRHDRARAQRLLARLH
ncbi:MAG: bifunctional riboflavin kinase/FMN adenylyltransferase [Candidatus Omnitrophica bacterium]|nr:bifunctional riboflavin kinase/FMN adenylyltransferase [Candidatus Omnitrophota bacterium]